MLAYAQTFSPQACMHNMLLYTRTSSPQACMYDMLLYTRTFSPQACMYDMLLYTQTLRPCIDRSDVCPLSLAQGGHGHRHCCYNRDCHPSSDAARTIRAEGSISVDVGGPHSVGGYSRGKCIWRAGTVLSLSQFAVARNLIGVSCNVSTLSVALAHAA